MPALFALGCLALLALLCLLRLLCSSCLGHVVGVYFCTGEAFWRVFFQVAAASEGVADDCLEDCPWSGFPFPIKKGMDGSFFTGM